MKKKIIMMTLMGTMFIGGFVFADALNGTYNGFPIAKLFVNGKLIKNEVPAIIVDGNTLVPIRVISETLGQNVSWDGSTQTVYVGDKPANTTTNSNGSTVQSGDNGNFQFIGLNSYYKQGFLPELHVAGQVKNVSGKKAGFAFLNLTVTLFDANGNVVGTKSGTMSALDDGETGSFDITILNPSKTAVKYEVKVKG